MKVCVSMSNAYMHCIPIFVKQYNKYWGDHFELVGYKKPDNLPDNCTFVSLGEQRGPQYFTDDLRPYFEKQPNFFTYMMEDTFIKSFDREGYDGLCLLTESKDANNYGRINLTTEGMKREHRVSGNLYYCHPASNYRLSTQPSIWNKDFLLKYMKPGLDPWSWEKQDTEDDYMVVGPLYNVVDHNEGARKHDIHKLNLEGIDD